MIKASNCLMQCYHMELRPMGHGMGTATINLPEAQTDFIFAVIALGFGFVGGGFTIAVVCVLDAY